MGERGRQEESTKFMQTNQGFKAGSKSFLRVFIIMIVMLPMGLWASSGSGLNSESEELTPDQIQKIILKFAAKESEFKKARELYNFQETVKVQTLDYGNHVDGEYQMVTDVTFGRDNRRIEKVVFAPASTLERITMTKEDFDDIIHINPYVVTAENLPKYNIQYKGHEKLDELTAYSFYVTPRQMVGEERYFEGMIWVDDQDFQIVKSRGKPVFNPTKRTKNYRFITFETYREQIDGKYWFPTYTRGEETLDFPDGTKVRVREVITYKNYKQFRSDVKITYGDTTNEPEKKKNP
jgi:hypothetical protein